MKPPQWLHGNFDLLTVTTAFKFRSVKTTTAGGSADAVKYQPRTLMHHNPITKAHLFQCVSSDTAEIASDIYSEKYFRDECENAQTCRDAINKAPRQVWLQVYMFTLAVFAQQLFCWATDKMWKAPKNLCWTYAQACHFHQ